jgi:Carboxypeptidase regulatory-like domain/TonB dependent receptor
MPVLSRVLRSDPRRLTTCALGLMLALCAAPRAAAQEMATLQGRVSDPSGAPVPAAIVEAELEGAAFRRGTTADEAGRWRLTGLPAGRYRVRARHPGYATADGYATVARGATAAHDLVLHPAALVIDTVTVTTRNPAAIRQGDTEFRTEVSEAAIELLPLRRQVADVVALTPGVNGEQVWGGATRQANQYQLDGLSANHPGTGGDLVSASLLWIESVEVRGLGAAAEFGGFQGGLVNVVTKRGTNRREGALQLGVEADALAASNLQEYDVAAETRERWDVEAELRGPLVRDRLFYYVAGQLADRTDRVVNHLRTREGFFAPQPVETRETKAFGKLVWQPRASDELTLSGGYTDARTDRHGATGYEGDGAFLRAEAPTWFYTGAYRRVLGAGAVLEVRGGGFSRDERRDPFGGTDLPGVLLFGDGERPAYNNAAFRQRLAPSSASAGASLSGELRTGGLTHRLKGGGELSTGRWIQERERTAGMTWRPGFGRFYDTFDPAVPSTWVRTGFVPVAFGGNVNLDADVRGGAVYLQDQIDWGSRLSISPGLRFGWWRGDLNPADGGDPVRAVDARGWDPRIGITLDPAGRGELMLKAHWGRYHQGLFAQFFDRAEGGGVFQDEQLWYYYDTPTSPGHTFTEAERAALAASGKLQPRETVQLSQTGPVDGYRQPYVDQLVLGLEKRLGPWWKAELAYVNRRNGNMVSLVDRNLETNYTAFDNVRVFDAAGEPLVFNNQQVILPRLYLPNNVIINHLETSVGQPLPGGMTPQQIQALTWDPHYVLTRAPGARRQFHQAQFVLRTGHPRHGGTLSLVWTRLDGNLDNVSGYHESQRFAGPYVNPNQGVNADGRLSGSSEIEIKVWMYGALPGGFRAGLLWSQARGDRYAPTFNLSPHYTYRDAEGRPFVDRLLEPLSGQAVFLYRRGYTEMPHRSLVDLHLERPVRAAGAEWMFTVDGFNLLGTATPTRYNTLVNGAVAPGLPLGGGVEPELVYGAVRERVRPRSVRLGAAVRF